MRKYLLLLAAAAFIAAPRAAHAGYQALLAPTIVNTPDTTADGQATNGELFTTAPAGAAPFNGHFTSFNGDTSADPTISSGDLGRYLYTLNGSVLSSGAGTATYGSTNGLGYTIFYDLNDNGLNDDGLLVSQGNFTINAVFTGINATLTGHLDQVTGPNNSSFFNLGSYGPVAFNGNYAGDLGNSVGGLQNFGTITGTLRASGAPIPEPGSMALLATGLLPFAGMLRRRRK